MRNLVKALALAVIPVAILAGVPALYAHDSQVPDHHVSMMQNGMMGQSGMSGMMNMMGQMSRMMETCNNMMQGMTEKPKAAPEGQPEKAPPKPEGQK